MAHTMPFTFYYLDLIITIPAFSKTQNRKKKTQENWRKPSEHLIALFLFVFFIGKK